ncbi:hypothetical protein EDB85DRAFT_2227352 [Lactarius pseudohatsudake]|nr:hypothetical protein EDB85DRAFT_2227352 [Lactarius pseudohatsudake]
MNSGPAGEEMESAAPKKRKFLSTTFSKLTGKDLVSIPSGLIHLRPALELEERLAATTPLGEGQHWSSAGLYNHLRLLWNTVRWKNEASARLWIDAFLFRVTAMLPPERCMVLNREQVVPAAHPGPSSSSNPSRIIDYTAVLASQGQTVHFLNSPLFRSTKANSLLVHLLYGFFVVEAKYSHLSEHISQAVGEMFTCGKHLQQRVLRGALTNGKDWIFLIVRLGNNYERASYQESAVISLQSSMGLDGRFEVLRPWPDLIAGILSHWIQNSFTELGSDDWFQTTVREDTT